MPTKKPAKGKQEESSVLMYNGKALLRKGNEIYYGSADDNYVACFRIMETEKLKDLDIATKVVIELRTNNGENSSLIRQAERDGLYKALDLGIYWLQDAIENHKT